MPTRGVLNQASTRWYTYTPPEANNAMYSVLKLGLRFSLTLALFLFTGHIN